MSANQRPLAAVPRWVLLSFVAFLALQTVWKAQIRPGSPRAEDLPAAPRSVVLKIASLGEPATLARLAMLYLQSFDYSSTNALPYRRLDYVRLIDWLGSIQDLDPLSEYPLFSAARVYAEVPDPGRQRMMLEFVYTKFLEAPNRRWPAAAQAALVAKHRLKDLPLALRYARGIERLATTADVPLWARQMEIFILEDMNELETAKIMIGGLLASGRIKDLAEKNFLEKRLAQLGGLRQQSDPPP